MIYLVWGSDTHNGLKTDGIDRNPEIFSVMEDITRHAIKLSEKHKTYLIWGGDLFNKNNPSEAVIKEFIERLINPCKGRQNLKVYFMAGNHDTISNPENKSCLSFIGPLIHGYENVWLIEDIKSIEVDKSDIGPVRFTFLPHITLANIHGKKFKNTQHYINSACEHIQSKFAVNSQHYVFSHLNIHGAHPGSEENLLNKSETYLPKIWTDRTLGVDLPQIINGHIHTHEIMDNIYIVGSPIYCGFGEKEDDKAFIEMQVPNKFGEEFKITRIPTNCVPFKQLELDLTSWDGTEFLAHEEVSAFLSELKSDRKYVVKFDLTVNPQRLNVNWNLVRADIMEKFTNVFVKPISPKFVYDRVVRNKEQKLGLSPHQAAKVFLETHRPVRVKEKWALAKQYLNQ
jgi:DNA repair exonuclease SbcCD nuclease subunit